MATQPSFKDLDKRSSDLLNKDFPSDKKEQKYEWKGTTKNGVSIETNFITDKNGNIVGTLIPKYKLKEYNAEVSAEFNTKKDIKAEVNVSDQFVQGLKTIFTGNSKGNDLFTTFGFEYKHELITAAASVDYGKSKGSTFLGSAVVGSQGFSFGVSSEYFLGGNTLRNLNATLAYASPEFDASVFGRVKNHEEEEKNELGATYFHKINSQISVGSEVVFDVSNSEAKPKLTFGTLYQLTPDTILKAKFDTSGRLGLSYQQKFNQNAKLTLSTTLDTNALGPKNNSSFGFVLSLND